MLRDLARLVATTLVVVAASLTLPSSAEAATCGSAHGVSVVVDFHQLGGGVQSFCDVGGAGEYAAQQFKDAGHTLTRVRSEYGFVCQVDGSPSSASCEQTPPTNAYWSLWWSDGTSGMWKYSSIGVDALKVPDGGSVALSWQGQTNQAKPRAAAPEHASSSPPPTPSPSSPTSAAPRPTHHHAVRHATDSPTTAPSSNVASAVPAPSGTPSTPARSHRATHATHHTSPSVARHANHRATASTSVVPQADQAPTRATAPVSSQASGSGVPGWLAPTVVVLVFLAAGAVAVVRRRRSGGG